MRKSAKERHEPFFKGYEVKGRVDRLPKDLAQARHERQGWLKAARSGLRKSVLLHAFINTGYLAVATFCMASVVMVGAAPAVVGAMAFGGAAVALGSSRAFAERLYNTRKASKVLTSELEKTRRNRAISSKDLAAELASFQQTTQVLHQNGFAPGSTRLDESLDSLDRSVRRGLRTLGQKESTVPQTADVLRNGTVSDIAKCLDKISDFADRASSPSSGRRSLGTEGSVSVATLLARNARTVDRSASDSTPLGGGPTLN